MRQILIQGDCAKTFGNGQERVLEAASDGFVLSFLLYARSPSHYLRPVDFLASDPNTVVLGDARVESMYCFMTILFFAGLSGALFYLLAFENSFRKELRTAFNRPLPPMPKGKALVFVAPLLLLSSGWFYNASLGGKYFEIRKEGTEDRVVWNFVHRYPTRERRIPADEIEQWGGYRLWKRRSMSYCLVAKTKEGKRIMSAGLPPKAFQAQAATLRRWGIDIATEPEHAEGLNTLPDQ